MSSYFTILSTNIYNMLATMQLLSSLRNQISTIYKNSARNKFNMRDAMGCCVYFDLTTIPKQCHHKSKIQSMINFAQTINCFEILIEQTVIILKEEI